MIIRRITCYRFTLPFSVPVRSAGETLRERRGALLAVHYEDGQTVWGEASPLPGFSRESLDEVIAAARDVAGDVCGVSCEEATKRLADEAILFPSLYFAFQTALRSETESTASVMSLCALASGDVASVIRQVEQAMQSGYGTVKIKLGGGGVADDIALVNTVRQMLAGTCRLRFDANRAWGLDDARRFCEAVAGDDVDYIEEPLADPVALPELYEQSNVPCAVDETLQELSACIFGGASPEREAALRHVVENARALVWKPSLCMPPGRMTLQTEAPVILSGAYESGVGTAAILRLATTTGTAPPPPGIDTYSRLAEDVLEQRLPLFSGQAAMQAVEAVSQTVNPKRLTEVWHV